MSDERIEDSPRYHEKQRKQMCLLHALNNMFQRQEFSKADLDDICLALDESHWFNAHRSMLGLGNYDVNVMMAALQSRNLCVTWFDSRLPLDCINDDVVVAYIFNVPSDGYIPFIRGRHWFSVIKVNASYYNLDSKLPSPSRIDHFATFAKQHLSKGNQMLIVTKEEDAKTCIARSGICE
ncbi:hypothetical protein QR680_002185 [Steinernema hermaphroditum]|uniref:ubiquitinyl hydrolase 1 n=1 Tax=Steinernema hermaphroditum TaxID=289476 RepID=A0AA39H1R3_9BILA|nr:hypothetical protein QR680_002185 [Steinernema hermaphroditum]